MHIGVVKKGEGIVRRQGTIFVEMIDKAESRCPRGKWNGKDDCREGH